MQAFLEKLYQQVTENEHLYPHLDPSNIFSEASIKEMRRYAISFPLIPSGSLSLQISFFFFLFSLLITFSSVSLLQIISREFEPCKPNPAPVFHVCKQWSLEPASVVFVGDDRVDMVCCHRAGAGGKHISAANLNACKCFIVQQSGLGHLKCMYYVETKGIMRFMCMLFVIKYMLLQHVL